MFISQIIKNFSDFINLDKYRFNFINSHEHSIHIQKSHFQNINWIENFHALVLISFNNMQSIKNINDISLKICRKYFFSIE